MHYFTVIIRDDVTDHTFTLQAATIEEAITEALSIKHGRSQDCIFQVKVTRH